VDGNIKIGDMGMSSFIQENVVRLKVTVDFLSETVARFEKKKWRTGE